MNKTNISPTALVLGGGGARGWAHIGVLHALDEYGIKPDIIVGTSMGGVVGAAYAAGRWRVLEAAARELEWRDVLRYFVEFNLPHSGLVDGAKILEFLREKISSCKIEDLSIPFMVIATDLYSGEEVVLRDGDMLNAVRATIAIPGIFTPVNYADRILVDGGLVNPVPVSVARAAGAKQIIAVNLNHYPSPRGRAPVIKKTAKHSSDFDRWADCLPEKMRDWAHELNAALQALPGKARESLSDFMNPQELPGIFDVLGNSIRIMETSLSRLMLAKDPPDVLICPEVGNVRFMEFHRVDECIGAGYEAAIKAFANV